MMRRVGVAATVSVCSHAMFVKHDRYLTAGMDSDIESLDWKVADEDTIAKVMLSPQHNQHIIADFDSDRMMLVTDTEEGSALDSHEEVIISDEYDRSSQTLSPQGRGRAHAAKFVAEFIIQLNMTEAHATGMPMGVELELGQYYDPVKVAKVKKFGLVEEWNTANHGKDLHVGDEIVQVNDILWHHNTPDFVKRITGQFKAGRKLTPGANEMLTLYIQRPQSTYHKRYPLQRQDAHHKAYPVEFEAELHLPPGVSASASENDVMGWALHAKNDWDPLSISQLTEGGVVARYNEGNPDNKIVAGDEIVKVNNDLWHHRANAFRSRIWHQFDAFRKAAGSETLVLSVRRPASVYKALESAKGAQAPPASVPNSGATVGSGGNGPSEEEQMSALSEKIQAAASKVKALKADRDEISKQVAELVRNKMNISSELATAEVVEEELEAERDAAARRTAAPPALPMEASPGAPADGDSSAPPESDGASGGEDTIGASEDDDEIGASEDEDK